MTPTGPTEEPSDGQVVLGGKYVLGDILGTGGTYTVYEAARLRVTDAEETATEPEAALLVKVLHPHLVDDETARAAMTREIVASALVNHRGVVKVLDTGEDEVAGADVPWLLTRRLPGAPVSEVAGGDGLPWREALALIDGLLDALAAVHAAGLVHRDVGPRNVVVDRREDGGLTVGLLDLGLAGPAGGDGDGKTVAGSVVGMSPEQAQGRPLDARSDLYGVGALTYYALTGHAPYERARPEDVLRAHVGAPVPAPSARRAAVPVSVDRFVAQAMAKDRAQRFASADAMRAAAAALLGTGAADTQADAASSDATMTLGQIAANDPHRTAVVGAAGAAAAAAAAAAGEEAELQRTRQVGAVGASATPPEGVPATTAADDAAPPAPEGPEGPEQDKRSRRRILAVVLALVLVGAVGAFAFWALRDTDDGGPVSPATHSPSPTPSPSQSQATTAPPPPADPTTRSTPTADPTPTPSETPTDDSTPTPSPTDEPTDEPTSTPTADPEPTDEPEPTSTPDPDPTGDATPPTEPSAPADPSPGDDSADGGDPVGDDAPAGS